MITKCRGPASWNPQYRARVSLSNTYRAVLEDVKRAHGGILVNQRRAEVGWKDAYQLVWSDGMVERLLSLVGPHLRLKQEQATVMLEFIRHRKITRQGRKGRGFAPLPSEVVAFREALYGRIKRLNAKGPHSVSIGRRSRAIASTHA